MCDRKDCSCKANPTPDVSYTPEGGTYWNTPGLAESDRVAREQRIREYEKVQAVGTDFGRTQEAIGAAPTPRLDEVYAGINRKQTKSLQYTPLVVQVMFELYCFPDKRAELCNRAYTLPKPQQEVMELLRRAGIVSILSISSNNGVIVQYQVDEDALRAYVNAVCNVPLPTKTWEVR